MVTKKSEIAMRTEEVNLSNPNDIMKFATDLKELILQNKLCSVIQGKNYVNVEGWQIAGAFTGTYPYVEVVENLSQGNFYKYRAEVSIRNKEGEKVGYGIAICTNKEPGKQNFQEYAVLSMAQTRAIGKAYRMQIGWLLKIAGYETTPAEEMDCVVGEVVKAPQKPSTKPTATKQQVAVAKLKLGCCKTIDELKKAWESLGEVTHNDEVADYKEEMKAKILEDGDE